MKLNTRAVFFLLFPSFYSLCSAKVLPLGAVERIGFSKRDDWIGGASLYATQCPGELQNCGSTSAQRWCCPKDTVCKSDYCCPNTGDCSTVVRSFPSCADPSWTLCTYNYYGQPAYFCCQSGEQCFLAVGAEPACGPGNLPVQSTQKLSTVSPVLTATPSLGSSPSTGSSVSSQQSLSKSPSSYSSSSVLVSDSKSQVAPSITRGSSGSSPTSGSSTTSAVVVSNEETDVLDSGNSGSGSTSGSSGLGGGAIAGIVIGSIFGLALIALVGILGARYGSKKAIQNYTAGAANTDVASTTPPVSYVPENASVYKPELSNQATETTYYGPPSDHAELGADSNRR